MFIMKYLLTHVHVIPDIFLRRSMTGVYVWYLTLDPGKFFTSDKTLLRVSEKIIDDIDGFNIATTQQNKTSRKAMPSSLTVEIESFMMRFMLKHWRCVLCLDFQKQCLKSTKPWRLWTNVEEDSDTLIGITEVRKISLL